MIMHPRYDLVELIPYPSGGEMMATRRAKVMMRILFCATGAKAQTSEQNAAPSRQRVTAIPPQRIVEHEGNGCAASGTNYSIVWTFDGLKAWVSLTSQSRKWISTLLTVIR
jgi:hypothetical protein